MSELPNGWAVVPLGDLGEWRGGGTPSKGNPDFWTNGTIPWVSPKDMKRDFIGEAEDYITQAAVAGSATQDVPVESVLVVTRSGILKHSLPVAVTTTRLTVNQDLKAITPFGAVGAEYLMRHLQADTQTILSECTKAGTTVDSIDFERLKRYPIRVAPLLEQKRIVAKINSLTARTARARSDLARVPSLVAKYKARLLELAFSGRLTADWRGENTNEPPAPLKKVQKKRSENRHLSRRKEVAELPEYSIPDSWLWISPDEVASDDKYAIGIGPFGSNLVRGDYRESGVRLVFVRDIRRERFDAEDARYIDPEKARELHQHVARPGDVLITKMGDPPGDTCLFPLGEDPAVITADCIKLTPHPALVSAEYLNFAIRSQQVQTQIKLITAGVAQQKVSLDRFRQIALPIPPVAEQNEIVRRIETAFGWLDRVSADHASASKLLPKLDAAIFTKAFRGELVPQDPSDELADDLLIRIREARAAEVKKPRKRATKDKAMTRDPKELLLRDSQSWPAKGLPFEEIAKRVSLPHNEIRDALFALLGGEAPKLRQNFDKDAECMYLQRVSQ